MYLDPHFCQDFVDCDMKGFSFDVSKVVKNYCVFWKFDMSKIARCLCTNISLCQGNNLFPKKVVVSLVIY